MNVIFVSPKSWFRNEKHLTWDLGDTKSKALAKLVRKFDTRAPYYFFGVSGMPQVGSSIPAFKICQSSPSWKKSGEKIAWFPAKICNFSLSDHPFRASGCPMAPLGRRAAARWAAREFLEGLEDASTKDGE